MEQLTCILKFVERSFGFLLLQILGLSTTIAIFAQHKAPNTMVEYLSELPQEREGGPARAIKLSVAKYVNGIMGDWDHPDPFSYLEHIIGWKFDHAQRPVCLMNIGGYDTHRAIALIETIYAARYDILQAYTRIPDLGYMAIVAVGWAFTRHSSSRK